MNYSFGIATSRLLVLCSAALIVCVATYLVFLSDMTINSRSVIGTSLVSVLLALLACLFFDPLLAIIRSPVKFYFWFFLFYYCVGLLGISTYRDYINTSYWAYAVAAGCSSFLLGAYFVGRQKFRPVRDGAIKPKDYKINLGFSAGVLIISFLAAVIITATHGILFFNPEARFSVSAKLSYLVEFSLPVTLTIFCYSIARSKLSFKMFLLPLFVLAMLLSLGYRNQPVLLLAGLMVALVFCRSTDLKLSRLRFIVAFSVLGLVLFLGLSYLVRIDNSVGRTLDWETTISVFDIFLPELTLPIMPLHMASREGMGVTDIALQRLDDISIYVGRGWFFFLDFATVLPEFSLTSGRVLGLVVNLNETSSLTPSLLGGLLISYGLWGVVVFFVIMGAFIQYLWGRYISDGDPRYLSLLVVVAVYSVELTNRGIFKPMYIFALLIVFFVSLRGSARRR